MDHREGQEPIHLLGVVLGVGLGLLTLVLFGYVFVWLHRRGYCWHWPDLIFNLSHKRGLGSVAVELAPPFSISASLSRAEGGYVPFHNLGP